MQHGLKEVPRDRLAVPAGTVIGTDCVGSGAPRSRTFALSMRTTPATPSCGGIRRTIAGTSAVGCGAYGVADAQATGPTSPEIIAKDGVAPAAHASVLRSRDDVGDR
jgi:hypothetical protein